MKNKKRLSVLIILILLVVGCSSQKSEYTRYNAEFLDVFDTASQIVGYSTSEEMYKQEMEKVKELFLYYDKLFDIYNDYEGINNIKTINDQAGIAPVVVEPEIIELLELSKEYYEQTQGHVNVAFGAVLSIWHDFREEGIENPENAKLPSMKDLQEANKHTNIEDVIIDKEASTVYLKDPKMSLDVGAIAKGFGVELVAKKILEESQDPHLLFSIGGNIRALGHKPDDENWIIGIQNPDLTSSESVIVRVSLIDGSLVTSGGYQRYYTVNGKEYHHIINRDTLMPSDYFASVSIMAEDSALADAYSTALFNMSYEEGVELIDSTDGVEALWIFPNQTMEMTRGFAKRMILK